ncbi:hypothetical protein FACS1894103_0290 [Campylobacterota bacterium]|nr:hypothetical protein FACS1894103_0290 [Campylobacterota bacterium]
MKRLQMPRWILTALAMLALTTSLHALTITVDDSQSGVGNKFNITSPTNAAQVRQGTWLHINLRATLSGSTNSNDNWGCTSVNLMDQRRDRDHTNSRVATVSREINNAILIVGGTNGNTYPLDIKLYSGNVSGGLCNGTLQKTYTVYVKLTQSERNVDLALRTSRNIKGDMKVIGNTVLCIPSKNIGADVDDYKTSANLAGSMTMPCRDTQESQHKGTEDDDMLYAFVDNATGSLTGSINESNTMARLYGLPANAKIVQAKLYWIGRLASKKRAYGEFPNNEVKCDRTNVGGKIIPTYRNDGSLYSSCATEFGFGGIGTNPASSVVLDLLDSYVSDVKLQVPGKGYVDVKPEKVYYSPSDKTHHYMANADVTHLINPLQQEGEYYVRGVITKLHGYDHGTYGGWMLAVIYDNADDPDETYKNITIFDGLNHLSPDGSVDYKAYVISGFRTPIADGAPVSAKLFYMGGDGDKHELGDCLKFNWPDGFNQKECGVQVPNPVKGYGGKGKPAFIGGRGWSYGNAYSASITENGVPIALVAGNEGYNTYGNPGIKPTGSNPDFGYTLGFDLHTYNIDNVLGNNQQATKVIFNTEGDYFAPSFLGLSTQIYAPYISELVQDANLSACTNSRNVKGRTMDYTLTFTNSGSERAYDIHLMANFDNTDLGDYIDISKTRFDGIYQVAAGGSETRIDTGGAALFDCDIPDYGGATKGLVVQCKQKADKLMDPKITYRMKYSVVISEDVAMSDAIDSYSSGATLSYWNFETKEKVEVDAIVKDPFILDAKDCTAHSCVDPKLSVPVYKVDGDDGYYILKPAQSVYAVKLIDTPDPFEEPFLAYCAGLKDYMGSGTSNATRNGDLIRVYLPLPMSEKDSGDPTKFNRPNSNFRVLDSAALATGGASTFYDQNRTRNYFNWIEHPTYKYPTDSKPAMMTSLLTNDKTGKIVGSGPNPIYGLRLDMSGSAITIHQNDTHWLSMYFEFANINLIGTSFALNTSSISCGSKPPLTGYYNQVIKSPNGENCTIIGTATLKQVPRYKYVDTTGTDRAKTTPFFESCSQVKSRLEDKATDGMYMINPPDNTRIPFVADCIMHDTAAGADHQYITTIFMALDGMNAYAPESMLDNTCMNLGLAFFVPTNNGRYENMRNYLASNKDGADGWENYVGSVGDWSKGNTLGRYGGTFTVAAVKDTQMWPYGPFGVFKNISGPGNPGWGDPATGIPPTNGNGKTLHSAGMHSTDTFEAADKTMGDYGWVTIFDDATPIGATIRDMMQKLEGLEAKDLDKTWWIGDQQCRNNADNAEPNGDYDAQTWLGYIYADAAVTSFDGVPLKPGSVRYCNDESRFNYTPVNLPSYTHHNYTCVGLDSYYPYAKRQLSDLAVWEAVGASAAAQKIYTKMADGVIDLQIGSRDGDDISARVCARVVEEIPTGSGTPPIFNPLGAWTAVDFDGEAIKDLQFAAVNIAARQARIEMRYITAISVGGAAKYPPCSDDAASWSEFTDPNLPNASKTNTYSTESFSIRPAAFTAAAPASSMLIAGQTYTHGASGMPHGIVALTTTPGYTQSASNIIVTGGDRAVSAANFASTNLETKISFVNGASDMNITYDEVGEIILNITDKEWTSTDVSGECIANSYDTAVPNLKYPMGDVRRVQVGCWVGTPPPLDGNLSVAIRFVPDRFVINSFELNNSVIADPSVPGGAIGSFTYFANAGEGQSLGLVLDLTAVNTKGDITKFYNFASATPPTDGNYSKKMSAAVAFPTPAVQALIDDLNTTHGSSIRFDNLNWDENIWTSGKAEAVTVEVNFDRSVRTPLPPLDFKAADINVSVADSDNRKGGGVGTTGDAQFYYGRFNAPKVTTSGNDAKVYVYTELFCPTGCGLLDTKASDERDWQRIADTFSETNVTVVIGSAPPIQSPLLKSGGGSLNHNYADTATRPREFPVHLEVPPYLWHHPYGNEYKGLVAPASAVTRQGCFNHPCSSISFLRPNIDQWGGTDGDRTSGERAFDDNTTGERVPQRLNR